MQTLTKTTPARTTVPRRSRKPKSKTTNPSSALAGPPVAQLAHARTSPIDLVLEKKPKDPDALLPFLTGYKQPPVRDVLRALTGKKGHKVGTVVHGAKACEAVLCAREVGGELTLRLSKPSVEVGEEMEPDLRLTSLVMTGSQFFTEDDAWLVLQLSGNASETPKEMAKRINDNAMRMVNVVEHVPLPVAAALTDLLRSLSFNNLMVRHAVPRK